MQPETPNHALSQSALAHLDFSKVFGAVKYSMEASVEETNRAGFVDRVKGSQEGTSKAWGKNNNMKLKILSLQEHMCVFLVQGNIDL